MAVKTIKVENELNSTDSKRPSFYWSDTDENKTYEIEIDQPDLEEGESAPIDTVNVRAITPIYFSDVLENGVKTITYLFTFGQDLRVGKYRWKVKQEGGQFTIPAIFRIKKQKPAGSVVGTASIFFSTSPPREAGIRIGGGSVSAKHSNAPAKSLAGVRGQR